MTVWCLALYLRQRLRIESTTTILYSSDTSVMNAAICFNNRSTLDSFSTCNSVVTANVATDRFTSPIRFSISKQQLEAIAVGNIDAICRQKTQPKAQHTHTPH